jgi:hypothetical protein
MPRPRSSFLQLAPGLRPARLLRHPDLWILIAGIAYGAALMAQGRFQQPDFHAYYGAAARLLEGDPLYFITAQAPFVPYLYMPAVALAFVPFLAAGLQAAAIAWYAVNVVLVVALRRLLKRQSGDPGAARLLLFFAAIGFTLERELSVGNLNLATLVLALLAISLAAEEHWGFAGLMLAASVVAKPPAGLLALPMLARRKRLILPSALALAALIAAPLFFYGFRGTPGLYGEFLRSTADFHQRFADSFKYRSTTAGLWESLLSLGGLRLHHHWSALAVQYGLAAAAMIVAYRRFHGGRCALYVALALAPLSALSDYQVFMLAAPLVHYLLRAWRAEGMSRGRLALLLVALLLFGGNWHDLWGDRLSKRFFDLGLEGLGAWALIACALSARPRGVHREAAWRA